MRELVRPVRCAGRCPDRDAWTSRPSTSAVTAAGAAGARPVTDGQVPVTRRGRASTGRSGGRRSTETVSGGCPGTRLAHHARRWGPGAGESLARRERNPGPHLRDRCRVPPKQVSANLLEVRDSSLRSNPPPCVRVAAVTLTRPASTPLPSNPPTGRPASGCPKVLAGSRLPPASWGRRRQSGSVRGRISRRSPCAERTRSSCRRSSVRTASRRRPRRGSSHRPRSCSGRSPGRSPSSCPSAASCRWPG
ncbi:hypothetical protein ACVW19_005335 [Streptomyces sp. TE5632]